MTTYLFFLETQPKDKIIPHDLPGKPWKITGVDLFQINDKDLLYIADYFSKHPIVRQAEILSTENPIATCISIFV